MDGKNNDNNKKRKPRSSSGAPSEKRKRTENRETPTPSGSQTTKDTNSTGSQNTILSNSGSHSNVDKNTREPNKKDPNASQKSDNFSNDPPSQDTSTKVNRDENSQRTASSGDPEPDPPQTSQNTEASPTTTQSIEEVVCTKISSTDKTPETPPKEDNGKRIKFSDQKGSPKGNASNSTHQDDPQTSGVVTETVRRRRRCIYGGKCYRRSSDHLAQFSHPGDEDYEIKDERPECKYGSKCYRKNAKHWKEFKHSKVEKRSSTPVRSQRSDDYSDGSSEEESVDESEYDPSGFDGSTDDDEEEYESDF